MLNKSAHLLTDGHRHLLRLNSIDELRALGVEELA
jgi:hypothetical protein